MLPLPQPVAVFAMNVFAGNTGISSNPGLPGTIIICFLYALYAHITVGIYEGRNMLSEAF